MANKTISMLNLKRIIQLLLSEKNKSTIAKELNLHRATLDKYIGLFSATQKPLEELLCLTDSELHQLTISPSAPITDPRLAIIEDLMPYILKELRKTGVTLQLLWQEYAETHTEHYSYPQYCVHVSNYRKHLQATMHLDHQPGKFMEVDFAGKKLQIVDITTGEITYCDVLVCVMPFSGCLYIECMIGATQEHLFVALNRALRYFGGAPLNVKSDNMRQFITKNTRYEYSFPELANQWSIHYNTSLIATRVRSLKDKAKVEAGVKFSYLRMFGPIRNECFYTVDQLNSRLWELMDLFNHRKFQKKPGSRMEVFLDAELPLLKPLSATDFTVKHSIRAKVQRNYHILLGEDNHYYSVPFMHIGKTLSVIYDHQEVESFDKLTRVALHKREFRSAHYTTLKEHMPEKHKRYSEASGWNEEWFRNYAKSIGPYTEAFFSSILNAREFVEQSYKSCLGLKRLGDKYGSDRLEAACKRGKDGQQTYGAIKKILENGADKSCEPESETIQYILFHENIRGEEYYN